MNIERYLREWYDGECKAVMGKISALEGKIPNLKTKEKRICRIIRKLTRFPKTDEIATWEITFTEIEINTIINLLKQYGDDIDLVVIRGLKHEFVSQKGWIFINNSDLCDRTFEILPDEDYIKLQESEIESYFWEECAKSHELEKHFKIYVTKKNAQKFK